VVEGIERALIREWGPEEGQKYIGGNQCFANCNQNRFFRWLAVAGGSVVSRDDSAVRRYFTMMINCPKSMDIG
jgi:hypothetical protein